MRESREPHASDFAVLVRVSIVSGDERVRVTGTLVGRRNRPHLLEAWGQRFNLQLGEHLALFRYGDVPGVVGRVGTMLGDRGINIEQMAVGVVPAGDDGSGPGEAVMVLSTDSPVERDLLAEIVGLDGFSDGRAVTLG